MVSHCSKGKLNINETSNFLFAKLTDWVTDCFCLSFSPYQLSRWLAFFWLNYCLYPFIAIRFIYQSVCAYLNLWPNELMIHSFGLIYSGLCTFSPYLSPSAFQSIPSLWWYLSRFVCQCVHVDKEPSLLSCLTTFHHLSNWSLCYKTFSFASRGVQRRTKCLVTLWPRRGFAVIREVLLFIEVVPLFPTGSCPMPQRTLQPCWAHLKKELSTWRGPSLLMETVPSYATYWRFLRTVSHVIPSRAFSGHILPCVLCILCASFLNFRIYK